MRGEDRFPVIGGGERGGKSYVTAFLMLCHVIMLPYMKPQKFAKKFDDKKDSEKNPHFVLFGPTYAEPRIEFQYIENWLRKLGMLPAGRQHLSKPQDGPWRLTTTAGVVLTTWSMDDPDSIRALDLEGAAVCEAGKCPYIAVERVQGRVSGTKGFIIYSGTMEAAQRWYQDWMLIGLRDNDYGIRSYSIPAFTNRHLFPGGREDPEIKRLEKLYTEDVFAMRVLAEPRPPRGRVLSEITNENVKRIRIPSEARIELWIDPGYASAYAVLWVAIWDVFAKDDGKSGVLPKKLGEKFYVFDEIYEQRLSNSDIISLCKKHKYYSRVQDGIIDVASKGHRDAEDSSYEKWTQLTRINFNTKFWNEGPLIERIRTSAKNIQFIIDPRCKGLLAEAGLGDPVFPEMHEWRYAMDKDGRIISEKPVDRWNHCHDDETEILTMRGWINFSELTNDDLVATIRNSSDIMAFEKPLEIVDTHYEGELLVREGNNVNFAVTPNHRLWLANQYSVKIKKNPVFTFSNADDIPDRSWIKRVAPAWVGVDPLLEFKQRTKSGYKTITPEPEAMARFMGIWLAEGCLGRGGGKKYVMVDQKVYVDQVREIIRATEFNWQEYQMNSGVIRFSIQSKELYKYLCPDGIHKVAETKRVPREWVNASEESILALIDGYRMGDGSYYGKPGWWYGCSVSKGLMDDLQEMCFRVGIASNVYLATEAEENKLAKWYLGVSGETRGASALGLVVLDEPLVERKPYNGRVYCVTTRSGIIATRRNGRIMWGGNSAKALGYGLMEHLGAVERVGGPKAKSRFTEAPNTHQRITKGFLDPDAARPIKRRLI